MANAKKTWISIVVAAVIVVFMLAVAVVGVTAFFFYRHVNSQIVPESTALAEFNTIRSRFGGQAPMIEMASDELLDAGHEPVAHLHAVVHRERVAPGEIHALHVLAYDTEHRKLVRADIPRWLLELTSAHGQLRIADLEILPGTGERVTLADFDRRGPGLVMSLPRVRATELIVWTD